MRIFAATVLMLAAFTSIALSEPASPRKLKIGLSTDLTGPGATYGTDVRDAVMFAVERLGRDRIEIILEDDKCSAKDAVSIAQKFVNIDRVDAVIGPACSGSVLAAAPVYEKAGVLTMVTNASAAKISSAGDYIFRTSPGDFSAANKLFDYMNEHENSIGVLSEQTDYAQGFKESFINLGAKEGRDLAAEDYLPDTADFRTLLYKLRTKGVTGLFINSQSEAHFINVVRQLASLNWRPNLYGAYWPASPTLLKALGTEANGIIFVDTPSLSDILNEEGKSLLKEYVRRFGAMRSTESVFASTFEGVNALVFALNSENPKQTLYQSEFSGIFGEYSFDKNGEIVGLGFVVKRIDGHKAVVLP